MDIKTLFGKSRKSYALILTLLVLAVPLTLSGCGGEAADRRVRRVPQLAERLTED